MKNTKTNNNKAHVYLRMLLNPTTKQYLGCTVNLPLHSFNKVALLKRKFLTAPCLENMYRKHQLKLHVKCLVVLPLSPPFCI